MYVAWSGMSAKGMGVLLMKFCIQVMASEVGEQKVVMLFTVVYRKHDCSQITLQ